MWMVWLLGFFLFAIPASADPGFSEKYESDYNIFNPIHRYWPDNPLNPINEVDPTNPFNPINRVDPGNPANPLNRINPNNPFNPINEVNLNNPLNPINRYNPSTPFGPLNRPYWSDRWSNPATSRFSALLHVFVVAPAVADQLTPARRTALAA